MRKALVDLASEHPAWSLPASSFETLREAFGDGWEVKAVPPNPSCDKFRPNGSIDQTHLYEGAEVYFGWGIPRKVVRAALGTLKWVHSGAAGVGASISEELRSSRIVFTNSRGIHAEPVSDWVIAAIGFCARGFHEAVAAQRDCSWAKQAMTASEGDLAEFSSLRVGVVGLGGIGMAIARKCAALGMEVRAVRRRIPAPKPAEVVWVGGPDELPELAAHSDVLVLALPHTGATVNLVDDLILRALPRGAYVLNVSRGGILNETALMEQMDNGHIRACVLDVFVKEPLDREHPFWSHPRVFVTPHVSAVTHLYWGREVALMVENVGRFLKGDYLRNVVNLEAGY
ncbi:D-2-hydroxyacid dehydrogenase [Gemmatimonadota bacterium]